MAGEGTYVHFLLFTFAVLSLTSISYALDGKRHHGREIFRNEFNIRPDLVTYEENGIIICDSTYCTNITHHYLSTTYENLFSTSPPLDLPYVPEQCLGQTNGESMAMDGSDYICDSPRDDGDKCCATFRYSTNYHGWHYNTNGKRVFVFSLPSLHGRYEQYQMVTAGTCFPDSFCGKTEKACVQEYAVQHLLAYKIGTFPPRASFEQISVPSYCSCKNIGD